MSEPTDAARAELARRSTPCVQCELRSQLIREQRELVAEVERTGDVAGLYQACTNALAANHLGHHGATG